MLVDDDKNSREGYQLYLSAKGFRVHAFGGGEDALAFAKSSTPISSCSTWDYRTSMGGKWRAV